MTERELICKGLNIIRKCLLNIRHGREWKNEYLIPDINEVIIDIEALGEEE